jgi:hypothetical protein
MKQDKSAPAFPQERAKRLSSKKAIWLIALFGVMLAMLGGGLMSGIFGYFAQTTGRPPQEGFHLWLPWVLRLMAAGAFVWAGVILWKRLDEMALRAHLDAFYWGGSAAFAIVAPFAIMPFKFPKYEIALVEGFNHSATQSFGLGIGVALGTILLCYNVVWLFWWAAKR